MEQYGKQRPEVHLVSTVILGCSRNTEEAGNGRKNQNTMRRGGILDSLKPLPHCFVTRQAKTCGSPSPKVTRLTTSLKLDPMVMCHRSPKRRWFPSHLAGMAFIATQNLSQNRLVTASLALFRSRPLRRCTPNRCNRNLVYMTEPSLPMLAPNSSVNPITVELHSKLHSSHREILAHLDPASDHPVPPTKNMPKHHPPQSNDTKASSAASSI